MPADRYSPALLVEVAAAAAVISAVFGTWLAWTLANRAFPGRRAVEALAAAALALPAPVVLYFLFAEWVRGSAAGTAGLMAAGVISAAPLVAWRARLAFRTGAMCANAARSLGASEWRVFAFVELPPAAGALLLTAGLGFARVLAEMAAVRWLAGRFPL